MSEKRERHITISLRKLQAVGGTGTLTISIPIEFRKRNQLKKGDKIAVIEYKDWLKLIQANNVDNWLAQEGEKHQ